MSKDNKIKVSRREYIEVEVSDRELVDATCKALRDKYKLHGCWIDKGKLKTEESGYHSHWDVVVRDATKEDELVMNTIYALEKLLK